MFHSRVFAFLTIVIVSFLLPHSAMGQVVISGDIPNGSGQFSITSDITYDVIGSGEIFGIVFQDLTPTDEFADFVNVLALDPSLEFSLNGGVTESSPASFIDFSFGLPPSGGVNGNDGVLFFLDPGGPEVEAGDTFTLNSGTYALSALGDFDNPALSGLTFTGTTFLQDADGVPISNFASDSSVPEPSAALVLGLATALGAIRRRRSMVS